MSVAAALSARDAGMQLALDYSDPDYRARVARAIETLAAGGANFTADTVRSVAGDPPSTCSPNLVGALFNAAAKTGLIEAVGFARSGRVIGHGNRVLAWRGRP